MAAATETKLHPELVAQKFLNLDKAAREMDAIVKELQNLPPDELKQALSMLQAEEGEGAWTMRIGPKKDGDGRTDQVLTVIMNRCDRLHHKFANIRVRFRD